MSMFIRRRGKAVDAGFAMTPNEAARDKRLSFRSRGILTYLLSHEEGWNITTELVARDSASEGVDGVRTSFTELENAGYIRRVMTRGERGRWARWCEVYPYGDAPEPGADADPEPIPDTDDSPLPDSPALAEPVRVEPAPYRTPSTEDHPIPSSPAAAAEDMGHPPTEVALGDGAAEKAVSRTRDTLPVVLQRRLQDLGVTDGTIWTQAWQAANALEWPGFAAMEADRFPEEHLMLHLIGREEEGRELSATRWLRFYIADRAKRIDIIAGDIERRARMEETPQEREDRLNRGGPPPIAYGSICHGCGCMTATEPHKDGCHVAAKAAAETGAQA